MATPNAETLGAYPQLIENGKIRWCGASNLTVALLEAAIETAKANGLPRYETLQPEYNLVDRASFETAWPTSAGARTSASSPISAWRRAFSRASTAARRTWPRARAAAP